MPQIKSSKKRMELSRKREAKNKAKRTRIRSAMKRVRDATDPEEAEELRNEAFRLLDRAATRRLMHPNKVDRLKSQLHGHVNALREEAG